MKEAARAHFPPEFLNRLDDVVTFKPLTPEVMPAIVDIQVQQVCKLLLDQQVQLHIGAEAKKWLGQRGFDPDYGARPLKRVIVQTLLNPLAKLILKGDIKALGKVEVTVDPTGVELRLRYDPPADAANAPRVTPIEPLLEPEDDEKETAKALLRPADQL
jgi:ATP-dependent Clp protease ATP-binding subunit ClpB